MDLHSLITEQRNPNTFDIDERSTLEIVTLINREDARVAPAVEAALDEIAALVDAAVNAISNGGRLIYVAPAPVDDSACSTPRNARPPSASTRGGSSA